MKILSAEELRKLNPERFKKYRRSVAATLAKENTNEDGEN